MELWIRSQNKGALIKVEMLGNTDGIIHSYSGINKTVLGEYKSNERAIEVLDEIQQTIKQQEFVKLTFSKIPPEQYDNNEEKIDKMFSYFVYEMPKE